MKLTPVGRIVTIDISLMCVWLPMTISPIVVSAVLGLGQIVLLESALDFLRVGLPESVPTWGEMLSESREHFAAWWLLLLPGSLVFASVTATNALGEALRDALDPRAVET